MDPAQHEKTLQTKAKEEAKLEQAFLSGKKDEDLGVFCDLFSAKTACGGQDGGVASALVATGLQLGVFDAAVVVCRGEGYSAQVKVVTKPSEALESAGTVYLKVNVTQKLRELMSQGKKKIAVVCTPCEAYAVRKIQQNLKDECQITVVGLFCFEAFNKEKLKAETATRLGIDIGKAQKTQVRKGKFSAFLDGKECSCSVKDLDVASEKVCCFCDDFTSRFADVSVGSVGSKEGYSTVVVRSAAGENLTKNLEAEKGAVDVEEIRRLAKFKKKRAEKSFSALKAPK